MNVNRIQAGYDEYCSLPGNCINEAPDTVVYNILFVFGPYTDEAKAKQLQLEILRDGCDDDCYASGCRWSVLYMLCAVTSSLIAFNFMAIAIGAYQVHSRVVGVICNCALSCLSVATVVTSMVFRYNKIGTLAALSTAASKYGSMNQDGTVDMSSS